MVKQPLQNYSWGGGAMLVTNIVMVKISSQKLSRGNRNSQNILWVNYPLKPIYAGSPSPSLKGPIRQSMQKKKKNKFFMGKPINQCVAWMEKKKINSSSVRGKRRRRFGTNTMNVRLTST